MTRRGIAGAAVVALAAVVLVVFVVTNGFAFGRKHSERSDVSSYISSVNLVQNQMSTQLGDVMQAYRAFASRTGTTTATEAQLTTAAQTLRTLSLRITALHAPPPAAPLARMLAQLFDAEFAVTDEARRLAVFLPQFQALGAESRALSAALARALAAVHQPKPHTIRGTKKQVARARAAFAAAAGAAAASQADAIDAYDRSLTALLARVGRLSPPQMMAPAYRAQRDTLRATRAAGTALAAELRKHNRAHVGALSRRFSASSRIAGSVGRQRAEIAALKAYDARVKRIGALELRVQNEVARLAKVLP